MFLVIMVNCYLNVNSFCTSPTPCEESVFSLFRCIKSHSLYLPSFLSPFLPPSINLSISHSHPPAINPSFPLFLPLSFSPKLPPSPPFLPLNTSSILSSSIPHLPSLSPRHSPSPFPSSQTPSVLHPSTPSSLHNDIANILYCQIQSIIFVFQNARVNVNTFLDTLMTEPGPRCLMWLPILHRVAAVEKGDY